jgi:hypothetical protein
MKMGWDLSKRNTTLSFSTPSSGLVKGFSSNFPDRGREKMGFQRGDFLRTSPQWFASGEPIQSIP